MTPRNEKATLPGGPQTQLTCVNFTTPAPRRKLSADQIFQAFEAALRKVASRPRPMPAPAYHWPDLGPAPVLRWALRPWAGA